MTAVFSPFDKAFMDAISTAVAERVAEKIMSSINTTQPSKISTGSDRFLSRDDVVTMTSLSRESIRLRIIDGTFPKPIKISGKRVAWRESDVQKWMDGAGK